ncbi:GCN5-related N-acetyltransferase 6, chloroplastic isoform X2 [Malania oleifera]|uniref:GCN5-related N-acetyltransferase 6, chloroplastic isoform X2 n=1 Tax=Malania oleifera TaxID=397392 RepID=UPI0025AE08F0|nr:GCN5-related N-acetyltransferase 6, chloroplastic isoform X2 [Malania oleifera]
MQGPMSNSAVLIPEFLRCSHNGVRNHYKSYKISAYWTMKMDSRSSQTGRKKEELPIEMPKLLIPQFETPRPSTNLQFDRLQPSDQELIPEKGMEFGQFVAREAVLDEEYWTAAWLRAESHWENRPNEKYAYNYKKKFAEQEFNVLKRQSKRQHGQKCSCIVMVKGSKRNVKLTVLKSIVGTLDLSIRYLLNGETFPGERVKAPLFCSISKTDQKRYGYVANLCVAKSARRQGIASNMLHFAIQMAKSNDLENVFVHVHRSNRPAQKLYEKMGFKMNDHWT